MVHLPPLDLRPQPVDVLFANPVLPKGVLAVHGGAPSEPPHLCRTTGALLAALDGDGCVGVHDH